MRYILLLLTIALLYSCGPKLEEKIVDTYPEGEPKRVQFITSGADSNYVSREINYYQNGQKKVEGSFNKEGKRHGKWTYYREDGKLWSEGYFFEGKDDKLRVTWHENGQKHYEGKYDKGTRVGKWKFYDESGKMVKEIDYDQENQ